MASAAQAMLAPLDRARWLMLRALGPWARTLVRDRELRVAWGGSVSVLVALATSIFIPFWMLALGPLLLGVPHLVSDFRYAIVRPGFHRRWTLWLALGVPSLVAGLGQGVKAGIFATVLAAFAARGPLARRAAVLGSCALAGAIGYVIFPYEDVVFAHLHNLVAVLIWWAWRPRTSRKHFIPLLLFVAALVALSLGAADPVLRAGALRWAPTGLDASYHAWILAPNATGVVAVRLIVLFAFAQQVHYAVWLRLLPEEDRARATPRTFAASLRALQADFGWPLLTGLVLTATGIALWGAFDLIAARDSYLHLALFHGHLELGALAVMFIEGRSAPGTRAV